MKHLLLLLLVMATPLWAQTPGDSTIGPTHGTLYVSVDQKATFYLNGTELKLGKDKTVAVTLAPGDRLVAKASSTHYYRHLAMLFVSDDKQTEISFRTAHIKLLPDPQATDFTADQFNDFPKSVEPIDRLVKPDYITRMKAAFPVKNDSQFFWGDQMDCTMGCLLTADMFKPVSS